jgi:serine protease
MPIRSVVLLAVCGPLALGLATPPVAAAVQIMPPSWGLDRIDQRSSALDGLYHYARDGAPVHLFVVGSGVRATHADFGGRVDTATAFTTVTDGLGTEDCQGTGTAVAAIAGGLSYGVAKGVTLHPVRVVGCSGVATATDLESAVEWITATHAANQKGSPSSRWRSVAVLSVSLDAAPSTLNQAIFASIEAGVVWVAPAGDSGTDRCTTFRPVLSVPEVLVAGATEMTGGRWPSSSVGPCVDLFAPGAAVSTSSYLSDTGTATSTGTAAAAGHAAGAAALYLAAYPDAAPADVARALVAYATAGAVGGAPAGTTDRLLYSWFEGDGVDELPVPAFTATCRLQQRDCRFDASASLDDTGILDHTWDFGDGEGVSHKSSGVHHKYQAAGSTFTVTLTVMDAAGQTASASRVVTLSLSP